jgi:hypothetical protein
MRRVSPCVDKIPRGQSASEIPIQQPTKMELVVNRKTAQALGIRISPVLGWRVNPRPRIPVKPLDIAASLRIVAKHRHTPKLRSQCREPPGHILKPRRERPKALR